MADLLIRDVPDEVVAAIDSKASRLGVSRSEYVRRTLANETAVTGDAVTVEDLAWFSERFADLADSEVMHRAWQ